MILPFLHFPRWIPGVVVFALALSLAAAQTGSSDRPFDLEELEPLDGSQDEDSQLQFRFELIADVSLPGPLPPGGPIALGDQIGIEVAGGLARVSWDGTLEILENGELRPSEADLDDPIHGVSDDGRIRCSGTADGWIRAEKRCKSCRKVWRKKWKVRAPGSEFARPLVTDKRVYYGTTDNQVYSVKRRNGHRVWATDVGGRVIRPLALLRLTAPPETRFVGPRGSRLMDVLLIVPASGDAIVALEGRAGGRVARHELPENESFVGSPLTRGAKLAIVRQRYEASDAALMLFELKPPQLPGPTAPDFPDEALAAADAPDDDPSGPPDPE